MMNSSVQYPGLNDFADVEASADRLAAKGLSTTAAYAFAVIVKRSREEDFDALLARDELRRVGYSAAQADAIVHEVCLWRTSVGLGEKRRPPVALARPMSLLFG
jgi:hypothetical protein